MSNRPTASSPRAASRAPGRAGRRRSPTPSLPAWPWRRSLAGVRLWLAALRRAGRAVLVLAVFLALAGVADGDDCPGVSAGVLLDGVEPDLVAVGVVQCGQDPADARPVHAGVRLAQRGQPAGQVIDRRLIGHPEAEVVEARSGPGALGI